MYRSLKITKNYKITICNYKITILILQPNYKITILILQPNYKITNIDFVIYIFLHKSSQYYLLEVSTIIVF